jgi:phosphatidylethanolamine-binding protein (PEBP) family uncharacterized protein
MICRRHAKHLLAAAGAIILCAWSLSDLANGATAPRRTGFVLTSTTYEDGGMMPKKTARAPACGDNVSPQLSWANPPPGTKSYALTFVNEEGGPAGQIDIYTVLYGIPANVTSFAEGEISKPSTTGKFVVGKGNRANRPRGEEGTYSGPCSPLGASPHHYIFKIIATDLDPKALPPGLNLAELEYELKGHAPDSAALIGKFGQP